MFFYNSNLDCWFELHLGHAHMTVLFLCLCYAVHTRPCDGNIPCPWSYTKCLQTIFRKVENERPWATLVSSTTETHTWLDGWVDVCRDRQTDRQIDR